MVIHLTFRKFKVYTTVTLLSYSKHVLVHCTTDQLLYCTVYYEFLNQDFRAIDFAGLPRYVTYIYLQRETLYLRQENFSSFPVRDAIDHRRQWLER
jgi:hypothetical protein